MILVIDNYDSFTYNLVQLLAALGGDIRVERNDAVTAAEAMALEPRGIVISPGPGTPADAGISKDVIRAAAEAGIPVLGVCLGHQSIAEAFGATIVRGPQPVHGKTADVVHDGIGVLAGLSRPFTATRYHSLVVDPDSIPDTLEVTARTPDGLVMGLRHRELPIFGVQFHPESVLTPEGPKVLANFLRIAGEIADDSPQQPVGAAASVAPEDLTAQGAIRLVTAGTSLSEEQAEHVMGTIMDGEATASQIAALVTGLRMKGETVDEIVGFAKAMRARATEVRPAAPNCIDIVGTGGDGLATFNISTTSTFVVAGAGVSVAKHGNRAVSSRSGAADVLEALGIRIDLSPGDMARCIDETGVGFLFAMSLHASMRHAGPTRREIAIRTVFNVLGPLTNPAGARRQLLGVYDPKLVPVLAEVAGRLGGERVIVVHGHPGMDEVSASGPTMVGDFHDGEVRLYEITPESVGVPRGTVEDIAGGDNAENARILRDILSGAQGGRREVVVMNAAAALLAAGAATDLAQGVAMARRSIDSGAALGVMEALIAVSNRLGSEADARKEAGEVAS